MNYENQLTLRTKAKNREDNFSVSKKDRIRRRYLSIGEPLFYFLKQTSKL